MPSSAQWHSLSNRAKYAAESISLVVVDDSARPPSERDVLQDVTETIKDVLEVCDKRRRASSPSSFDKTLRQYSGSTNAYETVNERLKSAHESIMLFLAMEQRRIDRLRRQIEALETAKEGTSYNITGPGSTVVVVRGDNTTKVQDGRIDVRGVRNSNAANDERIAEAEDVSVAALRGVPRDRQSQTAERPKEQIGLSPRGKPGIQDERGEAIATGGSKSAEKKEQSVTEVQQYTAVFKERTSASQDATVQVPLLLDITSERDIISHRSAFVNGFWLSEKESDVKQVLFQGGGGRTHEAKKMVTLTWRPLGSEKWVDTDFYIVDEPEPIVILGKNWADFKGIFHDMDVSVARFRLPGRWTRTQQRLQDDVDRRNDELHESAEAEDRRERQSRMEGSSGLISPMPSLTPGTTGGSAATSGTSTPLPSTPLPASTSQLAPSGTAMPSSPSP